MDVIVLSVSPFGPLSPAEEAASRGDKARIDQEIKLAAEAALSKIEVDDEQAAPSRTAP